MAVYNADNAELLNALLPVEADFADLTWLSAFRHRQRAPREYIVRWDRFLDDIG